VFVERFWRTLKYEEVYLKAYESVAERTRRSVVTWSFTTAAVLTPRLTGAHPIKPYDALAAPLRGSITRCP
jgi:hypothetical protein